MFGSSARKGFPYLLSVALAILCSTASMSGTLALLATQAHVGTL